MFHLLRTASSCAALALAVITALGCDGGRTSGGSACTPTLGCDDGDICINGACQDLATICADGSRDGDETGTDCGGSCAPCTDGAACEDGDDCDSGVCAGTCQAPTCGDGAHNGDESAVDCGGACRELGQTCGTGAGCANDADCESGVCASDATCSAPSCNDLVENGAETALDCGGSCEPCEVGATCEGADGCASGVCQQGECRLSSCDNGALDEGESGIDCGGANCGQCAEGAPCDGASDCTSGVCSSETCQAPLCSDGVQNGDETGIDCAGGCGACADGAGCDADGDCQGGNCVDGTCRASHCGNLVQDGDEIAPDCGGSCAPCGAGAECTGDAQCQSGVCGDDGTCAASTCTDLLDNGEETGVDCGMAACSLPCPTGDGCASDADCASRSCDVRGVCVAPSCGDGRHNGDEADTDCGGPCAARCGVGESCAADDDCAEGVCREASCVAPLCTDGVDNGTETGLDCGGDCALAANGAKKCADGAGCLAGGDCLSGQCQAELCVPQHCANGAADAGESDVDCGGADCAPCAPGDSCSVGDDCATGVCGALNACPAPPCACQDASCGDTVKNQGEADVDCGGPCGPTCAPNAACGDEGDCLEGVCTSDACAEATCDDGVANGGETGADCGFVACARPCALGAGCASAADCESGICGSTAGCLSPACTCVAPSCGDGVKNGGETCDGAGTVTFADDDVGSATCLGEGYAGGGSLGCASGCAAFDLSSCTSSGCAPDCTGGKMCVDASCACPQGTLDCSGLCVTIATDPSNCGACGNGCVDGTACSAGACVADCLSPLVECGGRCVDTRSDNVYCGGCPGTTCAADKVCNNGLCVVPLVDTTPLAKCQGSGPPIVVEPLTGSISCAGELAGVTFRWGICTCEDLVINQGLVTDGFDSREGPYDPAAPGAGAGAGTNGAFGTAGTTRSLVRGALWASGNATATTPVINSKLTTVGQGIYGGGAMTMSGGSEITGDVSLEGSVTVIQGGAISLDGDLYQNPSTTYESVNVTGTRYDCGAADCDGDGQPGPLVSVSDPCDCSPTQLIDVDAIVAAHDCSGGSGATGCGGKNNDNEAAGLPPAVLAGGAGGRIDLDCGHYYFTAITPSGDTTIHVHGNVALYVGGMIQPLQKLTLTLDPTAQLDVFVGGALCGAQGIRVGSANYPANTRVYLGNPDSPPPVCQGASVASSIVINQGAELAGNFYAPYFPTSTSQTVLMYGSLFTERVIGNWPMGVHFDRAVVSVGQICADCGDGEIGAGEQCEGAALGGSTCASLGYTGGQLSCRAPGVTGECTLDTSACYRCGDGVREGPEVCDGAALGDATCTSQGFGGGTLGCAANCTLDTSGCTSSLCEPNGVLAESELCDDANTPELGDDLLGGASCASLGYDGGDLACSASCQRDTSRCYACGDGVKNAAEECDGADLGGQTCVGLGLPAGTLQCGAGCTFDASGCGAACQSCRDCNNQACIDGACTRCRVNSDCCAPLVCMAGTCRLIPQ